MSIYEVLSRAMTTYCEKGTGPFSAQPVNSLSSIFFFFSAYFTYRHMRKTHTTNTVLNTLPFIIALTGMGSFFWHFYPHPFTVLGDIIPIAVFVVLLLFFMLNTLFPDKNKAFMILSVFVCIEILVIFNILPSVNGLMPYVVVILFGLPVFFSFARKYKCIKKIIFSLMLFLIALFFRTIDNKNMIPFSFGTHFLWHTINAYVFYVLVRLLTDISGRTVSDGEG